MSITAIGQDSHRFAPEHSDKPLMLGGIQVHGCVGLDGNSDADVVLHALTNAVSGLHGIPVLGEIADNLCRNSGIRDSRVYVAKALEMLNGSRITHVSISIEAQRPRLADVIPAMRESIAKILSLDRDQVAITATSGEGLTAFGRGEGIQAFAVVTAERGQSPAAG